MGKNKVKKKRKRQVGGGGKEKQIEKLPPEDLNLIHREVID